MHCTCAAGKPTNHAHCFCSCLVLLTAVCPPGEQATGENLEKCGTCPSNTYKETTGISQCRKCPPDRAINSSSPEDHDSPSDCVCSAGREEVNGNCTVCGLNQYKPTASNDACTACPAGSTAPGSRVTQHDELADCKCQAGSFMSAAGQCEVCPGDTFSAAAGSTQCQACPDGFVTAGDRRADHDSAADCLCPAGFQLTNSTVCEVCPDSTYQPIPSQQPCLTCPPGTVTVGNTSAAHNSSTSCTCLAGQFKVGNTCQTCPANTFKDVPGDSGCQPCPAGTATLNTTDAGDHDDPEDCRIGE
jgi:hypothetical protein